MPDLHLYHGLVDDFGHQLICVRRGASTTKLTHFIRHSPTGFGVGYAGSGPADAARCILADYLGLRPIGTPDEAGEYANSDDASIPEIERLYQRFKFDVVAKLPQKGSWSIDASQIAIWLETHPPATTCARHREIIDDDPCFACLACETCQGDGESNDGTPCVPCRGSGKRSEQETL